MNVRELFELAGKTAVITGGSRGLGLQMAEALGEMGCRLAIAARKQGELDEAAAHLRKMGIEVMTFACDLAKFDTVPGMVDAVLARYGGIDILVNNAGASWGAPAEDYPLEAWNKVMNLNLTAMFVLTQYVGKKAMIPRRGGKIINVSSVLGVLGNRRPEMTTLAYNTSKGAILNFTRALACEWGRHNINVNAMCPGWFFTKLSRGVLQVIGEAERSQTPLGRLGGEDDLKGTVVFLASEASRHITGQHIVVDGGFSAA